jgi:hypothetical protein
MAMRQSRLLTKEFQMIIEEIATFTQRYFEVLQTQDLALFDEVFSNDCTLYSQQDGSTVVRPFAEYRAMVAARKSPAAAGFPRQEEILMLDVLSPEMVTLKVRLRLFDNIMEDHLNLMKVNGRWQIYAKHFYRAGAAA